MRMITHCARQIGLVGGATVAVRYFSLECELKAMRGARIPHLALSVTRHDGVGETWSVEADASLAGRIEECRENGKWEPLLDHLAERCAGHPLGELAREAVDRLGGCV